MALSGPPTVLKSFRIPFILTTPYQRILKGILKPTVTQREKPMFLKQPKTLITVLILLIVVGMSLSFNALKPLAQAEGAELKPYLTDNDWIRVGLTKGGVMEWSYRAIAMSSTDGFGVFDVNRKALLELPANQVLSFSKLLGEQGVLLEWQDAQKQPQQLTAQLPLRMYSQKETGFLKLSGVTKKGQAPSYRGFFEVIADPDKPENIHLVNVVPLGFYLQGVVPNEMPTGFGQEASKTQAVLARNYAINPREKPFKLFDICDSPYCQAYYGANTENTGVNQLIQQTQGIVALYQGEPIVALYSSTHGGVSESHENVFNDGQKYPGVKIPYLTGRSDMPLDKDLSQEANARAYYQSKPPSYDVDSPLYRWQRKVSAAELTKTFNVSLQRLSKSSFVKFEENPKALPTGQEGLFNTLKEILVLQRGTSGKVMRLKVVTDTGSWTVSKEGLIRQLFEGAGQKALPSANFVITHTAGPDKKLATITLDGGGFGHGVGMSQYGAGYLAKQGKKFTDIIKHYYRQVQMGTIPLLVTSQKPETRLDFMPNFTKAKLMVKAEYPGTLRVSLNNKPLDIVVMEANRLASQDVSSLLLPNQRNGLQVKFNNISNNNFPQQTTTPWLAKVWLEFE